MGGPSSDRPPGVYHVESNAVNAAIAAAALLITLAICGTMMFCVTEVNLYVATGVGMQKL